MSGSERVQPQFPAAETGTEREAEPLHVLHLVQPVDGGVARVVVDLVRHQLLDGMRVSVACPRAGRLGAELARLGADTYVWEATRAPGPSLVGESVRAGRLVRRLGPDVVHAHSAKAGVAARVAVRGRVPTVFQPHAWSFEAVTGAVALASRLWERVAVRWTARVVCVSEGERRTGERAGVRARWSVVPNGVDLERYRPRRDGEDPRAALPALAHLAPNAPLVVCVGRLCRQKGQDVLLDAWRELGRELPGARLVLVGDGPDEQALRAAAPGSVVFAGAVEDVTAWYRAADVVVLPSRWEGMALAPLEAMACQKPVVVTDVGGSSQSLPPGHAPFCLVPPDSPQALARAVGALLRDAPLRDALGHQGHQHVSTTHDVRQTAGTIADVYREVAGARRSEYREAIHQ
ncbi:glycosyltransferase family 4 protein [Streptomyces sp. NPDC020719]|uniref:glycosyltransferase family 4 protein n=1 Tax=Streptomyces sp. NPDC020719 TaxID=3154896 RepID=UPI0033D90E95